MSGNTRRLENEKNKALEEKDYSGLMLMSIECIFGYFETGSIDHNFGRLAPNSVFIQFLSLE